MRHHADDRAVRAAVFTGVALMGAHVAATATNDSLFLSFFAVSSLPTMLIVSSLAAMGAVLGASRMLARAGPARVVPAAFLASAAILAALWLLMPVAPRAAAVLLFLHVTSFGSILISGFWSMINERFDPHTAKQKIGAIGLGTGIGGVAGGLVAGAVATGFGQSAMLPLLAAAHLFCAAMLRGLRTEPAAAGPRTVQEPPVPGLQTVARNPYLRHLGALVLLVSVTCVLLEYVFKAHAVQSFDKGAPLLQFFSAYYLAVGIASLALQMALTRVSLEKLGLAGVVSALPCATAAGAAGALAMPGLATAGLASFADTILQNSLFRSAYELLYVPIAPAEKRAAKTVVDVGIRRLADALGGGLAKLILAAAPAVAAPVMLVLAAALSVGEFFLAFVLRRDYVASLRQSLARRAGELDLDEFADSLSRTILLEFSARPPNTAKTGAAPKPADPDAEAMAILRSGDLASIQTLLADPRDLGPPLIPQVVALLARDETWPIALKTLTLLLPEHLETLAAILADPGAEFTVRRRLPLAFRSCSDPRALAALLGGLSDARFEVRYHCARVLARTHHRQPAAPIDPSRILSALESELSSPPQLWKNRSLLDRPDAWCPSLFADDILPAPPPPALEYAFLLLSLLKDFDPLRLAFRALHTDDPHLRGTALEYLASLLPPSLAGRLLIRLEADPASIGTPDRKKAEESLMLSGASIELNLSRSQPPANRARFHKGTANSSRNQ